MKASTWFAKNTQQAVLVKSGVLPVILKSGTSTKSAKERPSIAETNDFIVGESEVGSNDTVGGTI